MKRSELVKACFEISEKISDTLYKKGSDYSGDEDIFRNFELFYFITRGKPIVVTPLISCLIRQLDKIQRAINLELSGDNNVGETKEDTLLDSIGYGYMSYLINKEMKKEKVRVRDEF